MGLLRAGLSVCGLASLAVSLHLLLSVTAFAALGCTLHYLQKPRFVKFARVHLSRAQESTHWLSRQVAVHYQRGYHILEGVTEVMYEIV